MELVGSGLRYHVDLGSGVTAVLGGEVVDLDANFLNGVGRREINTGIARRIIEVAAVESEEVHIGAAAVDVHLRAATSVAHRLRSVDVEDAGKNTGQTDDVPAIERQVLHALVIDQSGDRGGSRIDQGPLR